MGKQKHIELFCPSCHSVYSGEDGRCCGVESVAFDVSKHGRELIGKSNSWISVWRAWKHDSVLGKVEAELIKDGHYGQATILNAFVQKLKSCYDECSERPIE